MSMARRFRWLILLLTAAIVDGQDNATNACGPSAIPQYALVADADIAEGLKVETRDVTKATCTHFCNVNRNDKGEAYPCKAFGYHEAAKACYLFDERAYQSGPANATEGEGILVFEKVCLTGPQVCNIVPAFERNPGRVLNGFTQVVLEHISSQEACLGECLQSATRHNFQCMSVMYYYETRECMLNFDTKVSVGIADFFSNDTENYNVDYYDNVCAIRKRDGGVPFNACSDRSTPTFLRHNGTEIPQPYAATYTGISVLDCLKRCNEAENFTCKSVDYRSSDSSCSLSFIGYQTTPFSNDTDTNTSTEYIHYERECIEGARLLCGADNRVSFDVTFGVRMPSEFQVLAVSSISPQECLSLCLLDPSNRCRSVNYETTTSLCELNNATRVDAALVDAAGGDPLFAYYENLCHPGTVAIAPDSAKEEAVSQSPRTNLTDHESETPKTSNVPNMEMHPICEYSDMRVRMLAEKPFTGFLFAKNKFGTCRVDVENRAEVVLPLQFPDFQGTESPCGVAEVGRNTYSVIVVVTANNMDIPGLVTDGDRFFNVTCDFTASASNLVTATGRSMLVENRKDSPALYPDGVVSIPSPLNMQLNRNDDPGTQVQKAVLGEQLNLDFHFYPGFNRTGMGLFVRQCNASRYFGPPPHPAPLVLIDDGCPSPAARGKIINSAVLEIPDGFRLPFIVFRFDGSNSVKISCAIDMCENGCNPTQCAVNGEQVRSYGRKRRRRSFLRANTTAPKKSESSSVVFTVVDKILADGSEPEPRQNLTNVMHRLHVVRQQPSRGYLDQIIAYNHVGQKRQVCLKRGVFLGVSAFLSVVCFAQAVVIAAYVANQYVTLGGKIRE